MSKQIIDLVDKGLINNKILIEKDGLMKSIAVSPGVVDHLKKVTAEMMPSITHLWVMTYSGGDEIQREQIF